MSSNNQKRQRFITFIFVHTIQYPRTMKNNIYHSNKWGLPLFLHLDFNPVIIHTLVHSVDKTHVLDDEHVVQHTCCSNVLNFKVGQGTNRCEIVINISNLTVGVKHSIGCRTTFSPNLHSVEEESLECLSVLQH